MEPGETGLGSQNEGEVPGEIDEVGRAAGAVRPVGGLNGEHDVGDEPRSDRDQEERQRSAIPRERSPRRHGRDRRQEGEIAHRIGQRDDRPDGVAAQLRDRRQQHEMHERHPAANHDDRDVGPDAPGQQLFSCARRRQDQQPDEQAWVEGEIEGVGNGRERLLPAKVVPAIDKIAD